MNIEPQHEAIACFTVDLMLADDELRHKVNSAGLAFGEIAVEFDYGVDGHVTMVIHAKLENVSKP